VDEATDQIERAAIAWYLWVKQPTASAADRAACDAWRAADPAHARAFAAAAALWDRLERPATELGAGDWYRPRRAPSPVWRFARRAGLAAATLAIIAIGVLWRDPGLLDRARADHATAPGARAEVLLADGSRAYLDGDSAIAVDFRGTARSLRLLRGRAWFDVAPDPARGFTVQAGAVEAQVLGTAFAVELAPQVTGVTVERGRVAVAVAGQRAAALGPGQRLRLANGQVEQDSVNPETALAWRRGVIVFDRATLKAVVAELDRMGPGRVLVTDAALGELTLSGVFRADDREAVLGALRSGLGLKTTSLPAVATLIHR